MEKLSRLFLDPPPLPPLKLPVPLRYVPGVRQSIGEAYKAVYFEGAMDGFTLGMSLAVVIILGLALRGNVFKGIGNVFSSI